MEFVPKWLAWEITRRCNLNCVHCRSSSQLEVRNHPDFSWEEGVRILDDIASYASPVIVLTGGEPLLRGDVFDLADYGSKKGLRMCLATNGTLVTQETCDRIRETDIKMVAVSMDGSTAEIHDNFRNQKGAFDGMLNAVRLFRENGIDFLVNSSFTKRNQHDIGNVYRLAKKLGATAWYMFMIVPTGRGEDVMDELISLDDYEDILEWHYDMEKEEKEMLVRPTCAPSYYRIFSQKKRELGDDLKRRTLKFSTGGSKGCVAGQVIALLDVDGNLLPCSYFPMAAGNIREQSFKDIWENSELFKSLRDFKSYKGRCGSCEYINICGGCRARAYAIYGDYLEEEPFCTHVPLNESKKIT
ncbi:MAG: radical SAM protein [Desulfobia sp.]